MPSEEECQQEPTSAFGTIKKVFANITVEPLVICWLLPFLTTYAAIENMNLEMACRELVTPQTGFEKDVCKLFVRQQEFNISCPDEENIANATYFGDFDDEAIRQKFPDVYDSIANKTAAVHRFLCEAESTVQLRLSVINSIRNPISSIGPFIIVLFAGPWADKKNLRVPCMLVPYVGEAVGYFTLFVASIFINWPVEFPAYAYRLIPSLTGAENLMVMGIFSYLTATSSDENRTFRFGMFQILMTIVPIIAQSISPTLLKEFNYTQLFGAMVPVHVIGLFYAVFFLKEVKIPKKEEENNKEGAAYDNPAMTSDETATSIDTKNTDETVAETVVQTKNAFLEFFDPQHAIDCVRSFLKKREHGLRSIIILIMLMHFVSNGVTQGESQNLYLYLRYKLGWEIDLYVYHNVFTIVVGLIGTSLAVGILSKLLKMSDIMLVLISTALSIVCRGFYFSARNKEMFFAGTAIDLMYSVKILGTRSIISKNVDDLSTMFAIMAIFEALAGSVFPYIYPTLYQFLLDTKGYDVSEMFLLSGALMILSFLVYLIVWNLLRKKERIEALTQNGDTKLTVTSEETKL